MTNAAFRNLPAVSDVLEQPAVAALLADGYPREILTTSVRERIADARAAVARGAAAPTAEEVAREVAGVMKSGEASWPAPVLNATGVILHTNLGRAPLSTRVSTPLPPLLRATPRWRWTSTTESAGAGTRQSRGYCIGSRARKMQWRQQQCRRDAPGAGGRCRRTRRHSLPRRGERDRRRVPYTDVLAQSGARLVEVGTVNRTYASDYERAITEQTAALLVVHRSNFRVVGFTHESSLEDIAVVGAANGVPVLHDLGSGALLDTGQFGIGHEPMPQESLAAGADLVFFSGDKLLGGPQAGLAVGRAALVAALRSHPLARALRADKLTLAALHRTLLHYIRGEAMDKVPVWRMIAATEEALGVRAQAIAQLVGATATVVVGASRLGGGSLPSDELPTRLVCVDPSTAGGPDELARRLRAGSPALVGRIEGDRVLLDPRTVPPERDAELAVAVSAALATAADA